MLISKCGTLRYVGCILFSCIIIFSMSRRSEADDSLSFEKALNIIADFADRICKDIPLEGTDYDLDGEGRISIELNKLIKKLVKGEIDVTGKYKESGYQGLLQEDLLEAIKNDKDCKLKVLELLKDKLLDNRNEISKKNGAKLIGKIYYNGKPITKYTNTSANIELYEVSSWKPIDVDDFQYDNITGQFIIEGIPPGRYRPFTRVEAGYPFDKESGGDFYDRISGMNGNIDILSHSKVIQKDFKVIKIIHIERPVDNQKERISTFDLEIFHKGNYYPSARVFEWEPVPEAKEYKLIFLLKRGDPENPRNNKLIRREIFNTQSNRFFPNLSTTSIDTYYMFRIEALNSKNEMIGTFENYYTNGTGGWLEFKIVP